MQNEIVFFFFHHAKAEIDLTTHYTIRIESRSINDFNLFSVSIKQLSKANLGCFIEVCNLEKAIKMCFIFIIV